MTAASRAAVFDNLADISFLTYSWHSILRELPMQCTTPLLTSTCETRDESPGCTQNWQWEREKSLKICKQRGQRLVVCRALSQAHQCKMVQRAVTCFLTGRKPSSEPFRASMSRLSISPRPSRAAQFLVLSLLA